MAFLDVLSLCVLGTNACTCVWEEEELLYVARQSLELGNGDVLNLRLWMCRFLVGLLQHVCRKS
jgi:hypothetical protein